MKKIAMILCGTLLCGATVSASDVAVDYLGTGNTLVRVEGAADQYLMIPVEDNGPEARVEVLVDGRLDKVIVVRVANSRVDYKVPFDLSQYAGHQVALNVYTEAGRSNGRDASSYVAWKHFEVSDSYSFAQEQYRPAYHHSPAYGWMNDPNGMFYKDGVWHLYYQWNPYGSKWQNMTWGHSTSTDLIHWQAQPTAIEANGLGAVFSGSSVIDSRNDAGFGADAVLSFYTSAGATQQQSLAVSHDGGITFTNYPANPVICQTTEARDPNLFYHEESGKWVLMLAHALDHEMQFFTSTDLKHWTLASAFGKGLGCQDGVWECPDMFRLADPTTGEQKWVLLCNINPGGPFGGSATQYFVGEFDGTKFIPDLDANGQVPTKWMDWGKDNYATVSFFNAPEGRTTVIGWMSNWQYAPEVPTMTYRSANTLPRDLSLFRGADGQYYMASVPSPECDALRGAVVSKANRKRINAKSASFALPANGLCEIRLTIDADRAESVDLTLSNVEGNYVKMTFDPKAATLTFDRTHSGITDFNEQFPVNSVAPTFNADGTVSLRIFVDRASVEVFEAAGRFALTNTVFPISPYTSLSISATGGKATITNLHVNAIKL